MLHFSLVGAALFVLFGVVSSPDSGRVAAPSAPPDNTIVIDAPIVARLREGFGAVWNRPPSDEELAGLIDSFIVEEILVREALALGLDADDSVVRQRLRLKMEFLMEAAASGESPDDAALEAYLLDNAEAFTVAPRIGFDQVFLGQTPSSEATETALAQLRAEADPASVGERSLLPPSFPAAPPQPVDGTFGQGFFDALRDLPDNQWAGPVSSGYGAHLVRVTHRQSGALPPLDAIREEVERAWRAERAEQAKAARLEDLQDIYTVQRLAGPGSGAGLGQ